MKTPFICFCLIVLWYFVFCSCKPCHTCHDPLLVKVPSQIVPGSPISYLWQLEQTVIHSDGTTTSALQVIPSTQTDIHSIAADSIHTSIYLTAIDTLTGIHCLSLGGKYGYTCTGVGGGEAIVVDGEIPLKKECSELTICCLKKFSIKSESLIQFMRCPTGKVFTSGGVGLIGYMQNCKGSIDTAYLTVHFN